MAPFRTDIALLDESLGIIEAFESVVRQHPDVIAVVSDQQAISYGELNDRANTVASQLRSIGVGPESFVALASERSLELVIGLIGILKADCAYAPIDPDLPTARIAELFRQSRPAVLLTQQKFESLFQSFDAKVLVVDAQAVLAAPPPPNPPRRALAQCAFNLLFTSGSTGTPKGVINVHEAIWNRIAWMQQEYRLLPDDVVLQKTPYTFDVSVWELLWPLVVGARLALTAPGAHRDPERIRDAISRHGVTTLHFVPSMLAAFVDSAKTGDCPSLRRVIASGEELSSGLMQAFFSKFKCELHNLYGPTECAIDVTHWACRPGWTGRVPIGTAIANCSAFVVDNDLNVVPAGTIGELIVAGTCLARGYLGDPALTAEKFMPHPCPQVPGERIYRTGDLARITSDGAIEFHGRTDQQVKIRGLRIELGEIEVALQQHPDVLRAVVAVHEDVRGGKQLVAYIQSVPGRGLDPDNIREAVAAFLPEYMIPGLFVSVADFPLTSSGKLDRKKLPKADDINVVRSHVYVAPRTELEQILVTLWREILGVEVGIEDEFLELGGDSILALMLVSKARNFGVVFTAAELLECASIEKLSRVARRATSTAFATEDGRVQQRRLPLTPIQRWFFEHAPQGAHHWNQSILLECHRPVVADALKRALNAIVQRHEALQHRFHRDESGWHQTLEPSQADGFLFRVEHALHVAPDAIETFVSSYCTELQASLDIERGPLIAASLIEVGAARQQFLFVAAHHLIFDGVSWRIFLEDLQKLYSAAEMGAEVLPLPPRTSSYRLWTTILNDPAVLNQFEHERAYWTRIASMADAVAVMPRDGLGGQNEEAKSDVVTVDLTPRETEQLLRHARLSADTQINDVLLTALITALKQWCGHPRIRILLEGHGREAISQDVDVSRTIGWFTTIFPVVLEGNTENISDTLKCVKSSLRSIPRKGFGYSLLKYAGDATDDLAHHAPDVTFNYLGQFDQILANDFAFSRVERGRERDPKGLRTEVLYIEGAVIAGSLSFRFDFCHNLFSKPTIKRVADAFVCALREVISCLGQRGLNAEPESVEEIRELTSLQKGIIFESEASNQHDVYVVQVACEFEGRCDVARFVDAWQATIRRHAVLRSRFVIEGVEEPKQLIVRDSAPRLQVTLQSNAEDWTELCANVAASERAQRFRLDREPAQRLRLICETAPTKDEGRRRFRLVWTHHHILIDGQSAIIVLNEVLDRYSNLLRETSDEPESTMSRSVAPTDTADSMRFWQDELVDLSSAVSSLRPRAAASTHVGDANTTDPYQTIELVLSHEESAALRNGARRAKATVGTVFHASWALMLARHAGAAEVIFGTVLGLRSEASAKQIGMLINAVPVRLSINPFQSAAAFLIEVRQKLAVLAEHGGIPLVDIQAAVGRDGSPLFETLINIESYGEQLRTVSDGLRLTEFTTDQRTPWPLSLNAHWTSDKRLKFSMFFDSTQFAKGDAERFLSSMHKIVMGFAVAGDARLHDIDVLDATERAWLLEAGRLAAQKVASTVRSIPAAFELQAARTPKQIAIVDGTGRQLTYGELDAWSDAIAARLEGLSLSPEACIGVIAERSVEFVVILLGVLKAGCAYVPIEPNDPVERIEFLLADSGAELVITVGGSLVLSSRVDVRQMRFDEMITPRIEGLMPRVRREDSSSRLAYVMYTSGSTGTPKGVAVPHAAVLRLVKDANFCRVASDDVVLLASSVAFDAATFEIWAPLLNGGQLAILSADQVDFGQLERAYQKHGVTVSFLTTALFQAFSQFEGGALKGLRMLLVGGEVTSLDAVTRVITRYPAMCFTHVYGPTENTTFSTSEIIRRGATSLPIGRPISGTRAYVLDQTMNMVPIGTPGELYLGGDGLARGYFRRPELTAEKFVPDPFSGDPGARLYATGDTVRWNSAGTLDFLGRIDNQVKIRGFRVEPEEIQLFLESIPSIRTARVVPYKAEDGTNALTAYVVPKDPLLLHGSACRGFEDEVHEMARSALPHYMVPQRVIALQELPLNQNGKVDCDRLPSPAEYDVRRARSEIDCSAFEEFVSQLWREVLHIDQVQRHDDFFALGGHSLKAMQMKMVLKTRLDIDVPIRLIFDERRLDRFSAAVEKLLQEQVAE